MAAINGRKLCVPAARQQRGNLVTDRPPRGIRTDRGDLARDFEAEYPGCPRWRRIASLALDDVGAVDARRADPNEYLAGSRYRCRDLLDAQRRRGPLSSLDRHSPHGCATVNLGSVPEPTQSKGCRRTMVSARSAPVETISIGTPASSSMRAR